MSSEMPPHEQRSIHHAFLRMLGLDSSNDPVKHCAVYLDKENGSCVHVDGPLCDFPKCSILKDYLECKKNR